MLRRRGQKSKGDTVAHNGPGGNGLLERMIADDDSVAALGHITLKDDSGKDVRYAYCDVWRVREGRLASLQAFVVAEKE